MTPTKAQRDEAITDAKKEIVYCDEELKGNRGQCLGYFMSYSDLETLITAAKQVDALENEVAELRAAQAWRPISEAPRDGTWVMLCGGCTTEDDYLREGIQIKRTVVGNIPEGKYLDVKTEPDLVWNLCYWDGGWRTGYINPTHFMLLPQPPKGQIE